jgi:excinuclease UvrABC ATPase subunit
MLEIKNLNVHYGVIHALKDISLTVNEGEIVTLIGANGAGKTTTLRTISGLIKATSGQIILDGSDITSLSAPQRVQKNISQVPEGRRIFPAMTVLENLELGAYLRKDKPEIQKDIQHVYELFPILGERKKQTAGTLSGGEMQRIRLATQIGSGLVGVDYILDEPSIGLHQRDNDKLLNALINLRDLGNSVLVVEHDEDTIHAADYIIDIGPGAGEHGGQIVGFGTADDIMKNSASVTGAYLCGKLSIPVPETRKIPAGFLTIHGARENNLKNNNTIIFGIAQDNPVHTPPQNCRYDTCIVIADDYPVDSGICEGHITGGKYAVFLIEHTAEAVAQAWVDIFPELHRQGYQMDANHPIMERYTAQMVVNHHCEICVPIY